MTDASETVDQNVGSGRARRSFLSWKLIAAIVVLLAAGGGAAYMFYLEPMLRPQTASVTHEAPLPTYLEVKPFVVSMLGREGSATHFVQIGVNLTVSGSAVANLITAMLPEVADAMRLTLLGFKVDDITTAEGLDKVRAAMTADVNQMLVRRLGGERLERANGGGKDAVQNIFFSQLVIE